MFCKKCGKELFDGIQYCPGCGQPITMQAIEDKANAFMCGMSLLIPIVGIVSYFMHRKEFPTRSNTYLSWAIGGFILSLIIYAI